VRERVVHGSSRTVYLQGDGQTRLRADGREQVPFKGQVFLIGSVMIQGLLLVLTQPITEGDPTADDNLAGFAPVQRASGGVQDGEIATIVQQEYGGMVILQALDDQVRNALQHFIRLFDETAACAISAVA